MKGEGQWQQEALLSQEKEDSGDNFCGKARNEELSLFREALVKAPRQRQQ